MLRITERLAGCVYIKVQSEASTMNCDWNGFTEQFLSTEVLQKHPNVTIVTGYGGSFHQECVLQLISVSVTGHSTGLEKTNTLLLSIVFIQHYYLLLSRLTAFKLNVILYE